jgi:hypothetical protein
MAVTLPHPGAPAQMPASPPEQRGAPTLGEYNVDVYCGMLGLAPQDLATLSAGGVI